MAGHSKWSNIKYKKKKKDIQKSKKFSKYINHIKKSIKPNNNNKLKKIFHKALDSNINKSIIKKIINKIDNQEKEICFIKISNIIFIIEYVKNKKYEIKSICTKISGVLINYKSAKHLLKTYKKIYLHKYYNEQIFLKKIKNYNSILLNNIFYICYENEIIIKYFIKNLKIKITSEKYIIFNKIFKEKKNIKKIYFLKNLLRKKDFISNIFVNIKN